MDVAGAAAALRRAASGRAREGDARLRRRPARHGDSRRHGGSARSPGARKGARRLEHGADHQSHGPDETGAARIKARLPDGTPVVHRTGLSMSVEGYTGAINDVGLVTPADGRRFAIAVFVKGCRRPVPEAEDAIARIARAAYDFFAAPRPPRRADAVASVVSHPAIVLALAPWRSDMPCRRLLLWGAALSVAPDLDVLGFWLGVPVRLAVRASRPDALVLLRARPRRDRDRRRLSPFTVAGRNLRLPLSLRGLARPLRRDDRRRPRHRAPRSVRLEPVLPSLAPDSASPRSGSAASSDLAGSRSSRASSSQCGSPARPLARSGSS